MLCLHVYQLVKNFPMEERFALADQMRRSASSIPINIAEGNSRFTRNDRKRFLLIALSSLNELHCECLLAHELQYISHEQYEKTESEISRTSFLLTKLLHSISHLPPRSP